MTQIGQEGEVMKVGHCTVSNDCDFIVTRCNDVTKVGHCTVSNDGDFIVTRCNDVTKVTVK